MSCSSCSRKRQRPDDQQNDEGGGHGAQDHDPPNFLAVSSQFRNNFNTYSVTDPSGVQGAQFQLPATAIEQVKAIRLAGYSIPTTFANIVTGVNDAFAVQADDFATPVLYLQIPQGQWSGPALADWLTKTITALIITQAGYTGTITFYYNQGQIDGQNQQTITGSTPLGAGNFRFSCVNYLKSGGTYVGLYFLFKEAVSHFAGNQQSCWYEMGANSNLANDNVRIRAVASASSNSLFDLQWPFPHQGQLDRPKTIYIRVSYLQTNQRLYDTNYATSTFLGQFPIYLDSANGDRQVWQQTNDDHIAPFYIKLPTPMTLPGNFVVTFINGDQQIGQQVNANWATGLAGVTVAPLQGGYADWSILLQLDTSCTCRNVRLIEGQC